jgi:hypothetical protein
MAGFDGNATVTDQGTAGGGSLGFLCFGRRGLFHQHLPDTLGRGGQRPRPHEPENQDHPQTKSATRNLSHQSFHYLQSKSPETGNEPRLNKIAFGDH